MKYFISIIAIILIYSGLNSQTLLLPEQAISLGLENNFAIKVSKNNVEISRNNNTAGNAGMLPSIDATGSYSETMNSSKQQYYDGRLREATNARSTAYNAGLSLNWTLFDGMGMFVERRRLDELEKSGQTELVNQIEATVAQITVTYYSIVQQNNQINLLNNALRFSRKRKALALQKYNLGLTSELDYRQAMTDLIADSANLLRQQSNMQRAKASLNTLLARDAAINFTVTDTIMMLPDLSFDELSQPLTESNSTIELATRKHQIAIYEARLARSTQYPTLNFSADYSFTKSSSAIGLIESNRNYGPSAGLSLSYSIFDGFKNRKHMRNATINEQNATLAIEETTQAIKSTLYVLYTDYLTQKQLVALEQNNLDAVKNNTRIALERYQLGQLSDLDLRQIQLRQIETENQLLQALYEAKTLETELLRLSGKIVIAK